MQDSPAVALALPIALAGEADQAIAKISADGLDRMNPSRLHRVQKGGDGIALHHAALPSSVLSMMAQPCAACRAFAQASASSWVRNSMLGHAIERGSNDTI